MLIDGGGDSIVATSLLDASNLIVLKVMFTVNDSFSLLCLNTSHKSSAHIFVRNHL
jgi:hypothetical protein